MNINSFLIIIGAIAFMFILLVGFFVIATADKERDVKVDSIFHKELRRKALADTLYACVTWPDCQYFMEREGFQDRCHLVDPGEDTYLDSSYMVPTDMFTEGETTGELYVMVAYHDSQLYENDKSLLRDYNGNVFIPVK